MPIILTLHVFGLTVTIRIKKQNRHSASDGFVDISDMSNNTISG